MNEYTAIIVFPYHSISINRWFSEAVGIESLEEEAIEKMFDLIPDISQYQKDLLVGQIIDLSVELEERD
jgi:low affinity Fe/Cu permease